MNTCAAHGCPHPAEENDNLCWKHAYARNGFRAIYADDPTPIEMYTTEAVDFLMRNQFRRPMPAPHYPLPPEV